MVEYFDKGNPLSECVIGNLRITSILDQGFFNKFTLSSTLHEHGYCELMFSLCGSFALDLLNQKSIQLDEGDFVLIKPNVYHTTHPITDDAKKLAIRFRYGEIENSDCSEKTYQNFQKILSRIDGVYQFQKDERIINLLNALFDEICNIHDKYSNETIRAILIQNYTYIMRSLDEIDDPKRQRVIDNVLGNDVESRNLRIEWYFGKYGFQSVTEEHMAKTLHISKRQLSRILQQQFRKSFRQILIDTRLNHATQLLKNRDMSIEDVAFSVGYTSLSGFYSAFRQKFGVTVAKYRHNLHK